MDKTTITAGCWMFKRIDSLSWQVFELREIKKTNNRSGKSRAGETDWVALPAYFGTLLPAIVKAKDLNRDRKLPPSAELNDAVKRIEELDREFLREVKKALKAVGA